ncbi:hypothetical protein FRC08_009097 [Ceratobasidium sp. 394]|nr:hypothetical protein FRC08_009097 [Ceratobasidium sp. 394]
MLSGGPDEKSISQYLPGAERACNCKRCYGNGIKLPKATVETHLRCYGPHPDLLPKLPPPALVAGTSISPPSPVPNDYPLNQNFDSDEPDESDNLPNPASTSTLQPLLPLQIPPDTLPCSYSRSGSHSRPSSHSHSSSRSSSRSRSKSLDHLNDCSRSPSPAGSLGTDTEVCLRAMDPHQDAHLFDPLLAQFECTSISVPPPLHMRSGHQAPSDGEEDEQNKERDGEENKERDGEENEERDGEENEERDGGGGDGPGAQGEGGQPSGPIPRCLPF